MNSIVIIGGGAAGLALAAGLSNFSENRITVIEKTNYDGVFAGEHLQSQILPIFEDLKIPKKILFENSTVCDGILGRWANRPVLSKGFFNLYGYDFIVHRPEFEKSLAEFLKTKRVKFCLGVSPREIVKDAVKIENKTIKFDYLFDCSGRTSRQFNNQRIVFDNLLGISFYGLPKAKNDSKIVIESAENGWWYHTFSKKMNITTYFTDSDYLQAQDLEQELSKTEIIKNYCGQLTNKPRYKSAYTSILKSFPAEIYQIGDSYFSLDPLSSQGIFKAFRQASFVADIFTKNEFESVMSDFYAKQKEYFFQNLKFREYFYNLGWQFYKSEFYKRRIELGLLDLSEKN